MKERSQTTEHAKAERNGQLTNRDINESVINFISFSHVLFTFRNIPMDKRVIDPRKGPITRNAATRSLPKISK